MSLDKYNNLRQVSREEFNEKTVFQFDVHPYGEDSLTEGVTEWRRCELKDDKVVERLVGVTVGHAVHGTKEFYLTEEP